LHIVLWKNGKPKGFLIHRLVAETFVDNPKQLKEINHINQDKTDNKATNLEWCDRRYNVRYSQAKSVLMIDKETKQVLKEFNSIIDAEKYFKAKSRGSITKCCQYKSKYAYGYIWRYKNKEWENVQGK
jgi:hypothetical protein